ncbi:MAG: VCBS repeat-containing protein [Polyangiales bacterium]
MSACNFHCNDGFDRVGGECLPSPPALLSPLSSWTINESSPQFQTSIRPEFVEYRNEVCHDRACTRRVAEWTALGALSRSPQTIPPHAILYWRSTGVMRDGRRRTSTVAPFRTTTRASRGYDTPFFDFDGDGYADSLGAAVAGGRPPASVRFGGPALQSIATAEVPLLPFPGSMSPSENLRVASMQIIGDYDGDGISDAAMLAAGMEVYFGASSRTERAASQSPAELGMLCCYAHLPRVLAPLGDINRDGLSDFATAAWNPFSRAQRVDVYLGRRDRRLVPRTHMEATNAEQIVAGPRCTAQGFGESPYLFALARVTPDSRTLFAVALRVAERSIEPAGGEPLLLPYPDAKIEDVGDIDGDGRNEAIVHSATGLSEQVFVIRLRSDCWGISATPTTFSNMIAVARTTDLDGDGTHELIWARFATRTNPEFLVVHRGGPMVLTDRVGSTSLPVESIYTTPLDSYRNTFSRYTFGSPGDMSGDGLDDFIVTPRWVSSELPMLFTGSDLSSWPAPAARLPLMPNVDTFASRAQPRRRARSPGLCAAR